ncbi:MAG: hypothetical protein KAS04_00760 [Candidatus Aenigmarchaeota archaeon]|nr:hypothetical protein [Candidatus Aenigmarchaeota archaeon]
MEFIEIHHKSLHDAKEAGRELNDVEYRRALKNKKDIYERIMITSGKYSGKYNKNYNVYTFEKKYYYMGNK